MQSAPDDKIREAWRNLPVAVRDRLINSYAVHDCEGIAQTAYRQGFEDGYRAGVKEVEARWREYYMTCSSPCCGLDGVKVKGQLGMCEKAERKA